MQMWTLFHPDFVVQVWHIFLATVLVNVFCCSMVIFANSFQPVVQRTGSLLLIVGGLVTVIILAASRKQHASNAFVWTDWENVTGWSSGTAFFLGMSFDLSINIQLTRIPTDHHFATGMING